MKGGRVHFRRGESDFENDLQSNATNDAQLMSNLVIRPDHKRQTLS